MRYINPFSYTQHRLHRQISFRGGLPKLKRIYWFEDRQPDHARLFYIEHFESLDPHDIVLYTHSIIFTGTDVIYDEGDFWDMPKGFKYFNQHTTKIYDWVQVEGPVHHWASRIHPKTHPVYSPSVNIKVPRRDTRDIVDSCKRYIQKFESYLFKQDGYRGFYPDNMIWNI